MESGLGGRTVARTVTPALHRLTVLVVLMAVVAIVGVLLSTRAVNSLTEDLQPAAAANQEEEDEATDESPPFSIQC